MITFAETHGTKKEKGISVSIDWMHLHDKEALTDENYATRTDLVAAYTINNPTVLSLQQYSLERW